MAIRLVASLFALFLSVGLLVVGNGFLVTLLSLRLSLDVADPRVVGGIMVCYSTGFVVGTLYADRVVQRVGHIRAFAVFCAILAIAALCYPLTSDVMHWALLRVIGGFAMAGLLIVTESWFSAIATNANRSTIFSFYQICFYLATSIGQLLVMVGDPQNFALFSLAGALLIAALIPLGLTRMQAPPIEHVDRLSLKKVFSVSPLGVLGTFASGVIISSFYGVGPLYATLVGFSIDEMAWFMAISVFAAMVFSWPIGWCCDRVDRALMMLYICLGAAIASAMLSVVSDLAWLVMVGNAVFIGLVASIYPIGVALTTDRTPSHQLVSASATLLLSFGIGSCIGPVISATLIDVAGAGGMYIGNTLLLLSLAGYTKYRLGRGRTVDVEHQDPFVPLNPGVSPVISELNPLNEGFEEVPLEEVLPVTTV